MLGLLSFAMNNVNTCMETHFSRRMKNSHYILYHGIWKKSEVTALIRDLLAKVTKEMRLEVQEKEVEMRDVTLCNKKALSYSTRDCESKVSRRVDFLLLFVKDQGFLPQSVWYCSIPVSSLNFSPYIFLFLNFLFQGTSHISFQPTPQ